MKTHIIRTTIIVATLFLCLLLGAQTINKSGTYGEYIEPAQIISAAGQEQPLKAEVPPVEKAPLSNSPPVLKESKSKPDENAAAAKNNNVAIPAEVEESPEPLTAESFSAAADAVTVPGDVLTEESPEEAEPSRYADLELSESDIDILAKLVYLESNGEPFEGQVAVAEVVFNRMLSDSFPDTLEGVVYQKGQFTPADRIKNVSASDEQYEAVWEALDGAEYVLAENVVYFSGGPYNSRIYAVIGNHYFCEI